MIGDSQLYDRMLDGMEAYFGMVGDTGPGGRTIRRDGLLASVCPAIPGHSLFNSVVYRDADALASALDRLAVAYDEAGVLAWTVWMPESDEPARRVLAGAGNVLDASPTAMAASLEEIDVGDGAGGVDWEHSEDAGPMCDVLGEAFGWDMPAAPAVFARLPREGHLYLARDARGVASACVVALDAGEDCGIYNVGTRNAARGRGLCTALMRQALLDARERGCTSTSLQATGAGRPVYARLGYRDLGAIEMWERRRKAAADPA